MRIFVLKNDIHTIMHAPITRISLNYITALIFLHRQTMTKGSYKHTESHRHPQTATESRNIPKDSHRHPQTSKTQPRRPSQISIDSNKKSHKQPHPYSNSYRHPHTSTTNHTSIQSHPQTALGNYRYPQRATDILKEPKKQSQTYGQTKNRHKHP